MLFRKKRYQDERVTAEQNRIYREIYLLIYVICFLSIVYKFIMNGEISLNLVGTEMLIVLVSGIYYAIRSAKLGLFSAEVEIHDQKNKWSYQSKTIFSGIGIGVLLGIIFGVNSAYQYADSQMQAYYYFFLVFIVTLIIYMPILLLLMLGSYSAAKKKSDKVIEKQLEE
ncbi:DUF6773 family protein [Gracilibacillus dipsosauri]|uniref:Uncharacterized protein n=2 Tax=Gracilibacillus TaxID=74385 RepID=A0A317L119_9BACI|nr:DUF6773 family protein [Gracilibacillus dipsosauri]PWU69517.1 hypothetical protein DLJ74_05970 [Gracilibacillus dipsosauri]